MGRCLPVAARQVADQHGHGRVSITQDVCFAAERARGGRPTRWTRWAGTSRQVWVRCWGDRQRTGVGGGTTKAPTGITAGGSLMVAVSTSAPEGTRIYRAMLGACRQCRFCRSGAPRTPRPCSLGLVERSSFLRVSCGRPCPPLPARGCSSSSPRSSPAGAKPYIADLMRRHSFKHENALVMAASRRG
jgi:hypothetical protein